MSNILSKLAFGNAVILTAEEALSVLAVRGEWSAVANAVAHHFATSRGFKAGEAMRFDSIGLAPSDFPTRKTTDGKTVPNYTGIAAACRALGIAVKATTDDQRAFYIPRDREAMIERVKAQRAKAAAKAKAKAQRAKAAAKAAK